MTSQQIMGKKVMQLNPIQERIRLQKMLLHNDEMRTFMNDHEMMINDCFEKITEEVNQTKGDANDSPSKNQGKKQQRKYGNTQTAIHAAI